MVRERRNPEQQIAAHWAGKNIGHITHLESIDPERFVQSPRSVPQLLLPHGDMQNVIPPKGDLIDGAPIIFDPGVLPRNLNVTPISAPYQIGRSNLGLQPHVGNDNNLYTMLMRNRHNPQGEMLPFAYYDRWFGKAELMDLLSELGMPDGDMHEVLRLGFAQSLLIMAEQHSQTAAMLEMINAMYLDPTVTHARASVPVGVDLSFTTPEGYTMHVGGAQGSIQMEFNREAPVIVQAHGQLVNVRTEIPRKGLFQAGVNTTVHGVSLEKAMMIIQDAQQDGGKGWIE